MPEMIFDEPLDSGEKSRVDELVDMLSFNRLFVERSGKWSKIAGIGGIFLVLGAFALFGIGCLIAFNTEGGFGDSIASWILFWISIALVIMGFGAIIVASIQPRMKNVFVLASSGDLFCIMSENGIEKAEIDRKTLVNVKDRLHGPSRDLTNDEICRFVHLLSLISEIDLGNDMPEGFEIDVIEEIEKVDRSEDGEVLTITYTDRFSGELRDIEIDTYKWYEFVAWLNEQYFEDTGHEIGKDPSLEM